jgi:hypothetical protein
MILRADPEIDVIGEAGDGEETRIRVEPPIHGPAGSIVPRDRRSGDAGGDV